MAKGSHPEWGGWEGKPPTCLYCQKRVTHSQSYRSFYNAVTKSGVVWHVACDPVQVKVVVEKKGTPCQTNE